jgi:hypothetical protein
VKDAVDAAKKAHIELMRRNQAWKRRESEIRAIIKEQGPQAIPTGLVDLEIEAHKYTEDALAQSGVLEDALIDALREDLAPKPRSACWISTFEPPDPERITGGDPAALPAGDK